MGVPINLKSGGMGKKFEAPPQKRSRSSTFAREAKTRVLKFSMPCDELKNN